ncbi:alpha/beta fold hydrolase [Nonomuraea sp. NPDC004186]
MAGDAASGRPGRRADPALGAARPRAPSGREQGDRLRRPQLPSPRTCVGPRRHLAAAGFDVYAYDQLGAGRSTRLSDVTGYTVARHVADLEAIRRTIGADRIVIVGQRTGTGARSPTPRCARRERGSRHRGRPSRRLHPPPADLPDRTVVCGKT